MALILTLIIVLAFFSLPCLAKKKIDKLKPTKQKKRFEKQDILFKGNSSILSICLSIKVKKSLLAVPNTH